MYTFKVVLLDLILALVLSLLIIKTHDYYSSDTASSVALFQ